MKKINEEDENKNKASNDKPLNIILDAKRFELQVEEIVK
jgi:hypothetical protein